MSTPSAPKCRSNGDAVRHAEAQTLSERRDARRMSIGRSRARVRRDRQHRPQPWVVWCDLNAEGDALRKAIPGAVEIAAPTTPNVKEQRLADFAAGRIRVLITKPSIAASA
jgi:hypothetical protein